MPRSRATVTAAVRSSTPSLLKTRSRWVLTVASLTYSWRPMSLLESPRATACRISSSRGLSASSAGARIRPSTRVATEGDSTDSPLVACD
jgi:hypothetical protein